MNLPLVFRRAARAEFDDAGDWYEKRLSGLGFRFTDAVQRVLAKIKAEPDSHPIVEYDVREAMVSGFPYCVYYRVEPT